MTQRLLATCAFALAMAGICVGANVAFAEGDGCTTYVQQSPPKFLCVPAECSNPGETCVLSGAPTGPQCACNGNWQYPFCKTSWVIDPHAGFTMVCTHVLCPTEAECEIKVKSPGVFYCKCE